MPPGALVIQVQPTGVTPISSGRVRAPCLSVPLRFCRACDLAIKLQAGVRLSGLQAKFTSQALAKLRPVRPNGDQDSTLEPKEDCSSERSWQATDRIRAWEARERAWGEAAVHEAATCWDCFAVVRRNGNSAADRLSRTVAALLWQVCAPGLSVSVTESHPRP